MCIRDSLDGDDIHCTDADVVAEADVVAQNDRIRIKLKLFKHKPARSVQPRRFASMHCSLIAKPEPAAILIMSQSADRQLVIPAWMPESSHKDVNLGVATKPFSNTYATDKLPSVALDSGIHAGMTAMEP